MKVKIIMFFIDMVNITSGQNNWCNFFPETGPFLGNVGYYKYK
jgi:hypothetical protein